MEARTCQLKEDLPHLLRPLHVVRTLKMNHELIINHRPREVTSAYEGGAFFEVEGDAAHLIDLDKRLLRQDLP